MGLWCRGGYGAEGFCERRVQQSIKYEIKLMLGTGQLICFRAAGTLSAMRTIYSTTEAAWLAVAVAAWASTGHSAGAHQAVRDL